MYREIRLFMKNLAENSNSKPILPHKWPFRSKTNKFLTFSGTDGGRNLHESTVRSDITFEIPTNRSSIEPIKCTRQNSTERRPSLKNLHKPTVRSDKTFKNKVNQTSTTPLKSANNYGVFRSNLRNPSQSNVDQAS